MSKYLILVVGAAVVIGGGYLFMKNRTDGPMTGSEERTLANSGTVGEIMRMGGNLECEIAMEGADFVAEGTVFIAGEMVRADFVTRVAGQSLGSSMIKDEDYIYSWSEVIPQGYRFAVVEPGEASNFNTDTPARYECSPWAADSSKFALPAGIEFIDGDSIEM